ncbi:MAG: hypothetical protein K5829_03645 [Treponema sp.]|nr:hypothetical protein [Treponema sp.]
MKKIVVIIGAAAVLASSVFAVDTAARVYMKGNVASGGKDADTKFFELQSSNQKDADALVLSANLDNAGAQFQFWYKYDGKSGDASKVGPKVNQESWGDEAEVMGIKGSANQVIRVRSARLWFKPVDMLKITAGDLDISMYKEMLHWWKDPIGTAWNQYYNGYSGAPVVDGAGFSCELTPIDGLWIALAGAAGTDTATLLIKNSGDDKLAYNQWGFGAKYNLSAVADLPLSIGVSWRDNGYNDWKVLGIGADYGNPWADGLYAMVNGRLRFNEGDAGKLDGITVDNYFKFTAGAFQAHLRAPVTIRLADNDDSWLVWSAKVQYALDGFTPYFLFGNDLDNKGAWMLSDKFGDTFNMQLKPGVATNVGACSIDLAVKIDIPAKDDLYGSFAWSVPFELSVAF